MTNVYLKTIASSTNPQNTFNGFNVSIQNQVILNSKPPFVPSHPPIISTRPLYKTPKKAEKRTRKNARFAKSNFL